jgi:hypothetical protein
MLFLPWVEVDFVGWKRTSSDGSEYIVISKGSHNWFIFPSFSLDMRTQHTSSVETAKELADQLIIDFGHQLTNDKRALVLK